VQFNYSSKHQATKSIPLSSWQEPTTPVRSAAPEPTLLLQVICAVFRMLCTSLYFETPLVVYLEVSLQKQTQTSSLYIWDWLLDTGMLSLIIFSSFSDTSLITMIINSRSLVRYSVAVSLQKPPLSSWQDPTPAYPATPAPTPLPKVVCAVFRVFRLLHEMGVLPFSKSYFASLLKSYAGDYK
jgi:hypothetical protein